MTFAECVGAILEGKRLRVNLPLNHKILGYEGTSIYIGIYEDDRVISVASAGPADLDWEVME